ncbi:MAG TPA: glycosyltransferase [Opitutaceae bacterium]|nr:glycosyltransferase [Opitutaceae bacterium]HPK48409.1 glycosyltransferase [Opitutaceae bacterium]
MPPRVSILIPSFNAARWLPETLGSVIAQTWREIEIVVIDDGSTDGSLEIAQTYAARHPRLIRVGAQANAGAAAARNHGLRLATGDLIKFLDADDLISPTSIESQVERLHGHPGHLAHGIWARFVTTPSEAQFTPHPGWHDSNASVDWICETWSDAEPMYQCGLFLIPRGLLERAGGWNERLSLIDDLEFFTRIILASDGIRHTPDARIYYRSKIAGSLSANKSRKGLESACLSTRLSISHLLARENTPRTRLLAANMLQKLVYVLYPAHLDLAYSLLSEIKQLGGATLPPDGGPMLKFLARMIGWRAALHIHARLGRRPVSPK